MLILTNATLLCRWILREVEAVFSSGHFLLVNRTLASRHILGNNRGQSQEKRAGVWAGSQLWIASGERSGLLMDIAKRTRRTSRKKPEFKNSHDKKRRT